MKKFVFLLLMLAVVLSMAPAAYAEGKVTYDGFANKFIFEPGSTHSPSDLFEDFKNVMPGDTLTETIGIRNDSSRTTKIRLYLRSLGAQENSDDFLSQMNLTVEQNGNSELFKASAEKTAQLTDWVYLGTVYPGAELKLDLTLEVPIEMGNDYMNELGYIDWQFKIEEIPIDPSDPLYPHTGDSNMLYFYAGLMALSLGGTLPLLLLLKGKKRREIK